MIQINNISKEFSGRILFSDVTFSLNSNEKIGFIGRNGTGKSTLFKILMDELSCDEGEIIRSKSYSIGELKQHLNFSEKTILEECSLALKEDEKYDTFKVERILSGLGFSKEDFQKDPLSFSGGYQIRLNLAKLFIQAPDLLLLDEPTNYLDVVSMHWLKNYLRKYDGEFILITHDRDFMNSVCNTTMGISRQKIVKVPGSVDKFLAKIKDEEETYENTRLNQEKKKKEIEDFITRFKAKANKAAQAQSRVKMLERMEEFDKLEDVKNLDFSFNYQEITAKTLVTAKDLSFGYTEDKILFDKLSFYLNRGEKIAIIGKNGKGKSTLLNIFAQQLMGYHGELTAHHGLSIGHFGQTNIQRLSDEMTIEEEIYSVNSDLSKTQIRNICASMMFSGEDVEKPIRILSGGEKSRVLLGKILARKSNLLLLDEPTNHLDQESVEALLKELKVFKGGVVVVTHNERVLRELPNKFIVFGQNECREFLGSYDEFLDEIGWEEQTIETIKTIKENKISHKEYKIKRQEIIKERSKVLKPIKTNIEKHENLIVDLEDKITTLNNELVKASEDKNGELIQEKSIELGNAEKLVEDTFNELSLLEDELTKNSNSFELQLEELESLV